MNTFCQTIFRLFLFCLPLSMLSQTPLVPCNYCDDDIFFWMDTTMGLPNGRVIDIQEGDNGDLLLLGRRSDAKYQNYHASFLRVNQEGRAIAYNSFDGDGNIGPSLYIYHLNNFVKIGKENLMAYGTTVNNNNQYSLYTELLDDNGGSNPFMFKLSNRINFAGDLMKRKDSTYLELKTTVVPDYERNVYVHKMNLNFQELEVVPFVDKSTVSSHIISSHDINADYPQFGLEATETDKYIYVLGYRYTDISTNQSIPIVYQLSKTGEVIWEKALPREKNVYSLHFAALENNNVLVTGSYSDDSVLNFINTRTSMNLLSEKGELLQRKEIPGFVSNGILVLERGDLLIYGHFLQQISQISGKIEVHRAATFLFNDQLIMANRDQFSGLDPPDGYISQLASASSTTFLSGIELSNGRIALGGRVYMQINPENSYYSQRSERYLVVFADLEGNFGQR